MATFVLAAILIILVVLALLVWPLLFTRNTFSYARHAQNIHYAKERLAELESQLKNATISATDYEALKLEIESTLADDIDLASQSKHSESTLPRRPNKLAISAICVFIPISAAVFYSSTGTPAALNTTQTQTSAPSSNTATPQPQVSAEQNAQIQEMVSGLESKLQENPNNPEGWALLARTYLTLGDYDKAVQGLEKVLELGLENSEIYSSLADATALQQGGALAGKPLEYAEKAYALNNNNRHALWLTGLGAMQSGQLETAKARWGKLEQMLADQPQQQQELREIMAQAFGAPAGTLANSASQNSSNSNASSQSESHAQQGVTVTVSLAPELQQSVAPQDIVFVFARAENGPPAPLAVRRLRVQDLPATITLTDQDSMVPQFKLSLHKDIYLMARVSKSGQPTSQPGDLESQKLATKNDASETANLIISSVVE